MHHARGEPDNNVHTIIFQIGNELTADKLCQRLANEWLYQKHQNTHELHSRQNGFKPRKENHEIGELHSHGNLTRLHNACL